VWHGGATGPDGDVDQETRVLLYGPFADGTEAKDWGKNWSAEYDDDPRWQLIMLSKENMKRTKDEGPYFIVPVLSTI
jgi:hypothetical protein